VTRTAHAPAGQRGRATVVPPVTTRASRSVGESRRRLLLALAACAAVALSVAVSAAVEVGATAHRVALFVHLTALVLGFGCVLVIDWHGLLWVVGRARLDDVVVLSARLTPLIWCGLVGLVLSGAALSADPTAPLTAVKLVAVAVLAVNGVYVSVVQQQLAATNGDPSGRLLARGLATAALSQTCWWTATVIGFLNSSG
jgi:hypothetical protein